jgi:hypothetical protein
VLGKLFVPVNVCLWAKLFVGFAHTQRDFASIEDLGYKGALDFKLGINL